MRVSRDGLGQGGLLCHRCGCAICTAAPGPLVTVTLRLQVGDTVWLADPTSSELVLEAVIAVEEVEAEGLFSPYTNEGTAFAAPLVACHSTWRRLV